MYTVFVAETVTGNVVGTIPCIIRNWQDVMGGMPTAQIDIYAGPLATRTRDDYRLWTTPKRSSLILDWDGTAVWAGPILSRERNGQHVTVSAAGFKAILTGRKVHDWSTPYSAYVKTFTGQSLGQIACQLVQLATLNTKTRATLPVVIPTLAETDTDPTHVRTYNGYELKDVATELDNLTKSLNGPDIHFQPQWVDSTRRQIQWVMRVGTLAQPVLASAATVSFDASAPESSVQNINTKEDGSVIATTEWAKGSGQPPTVLMSKKDNPDLTGKLWPLWESETDYLTTVDQATLDAHAQADLNYRAVATEQWTLDVNALQAPTLGSYLLGDNASIRVSGDFWIPDSPPGGYAKRIISISGDNTPIVKLGVQ